MKKLLSLTTAILMIFSMTSAFASEGYFEPLANGSADTKTTTRVAQMQKKLIDLGFLNSKADGRFGPVTEKALRAFQTANGLAVDGVYNEDDDNRLLSATVQNARGGTGAVKTTSTANTQKTTTTTQRTSITTRNNTRNTPDNTRNTPDNTRNTPDNTRDNTRDNT